MPNRILKESICTSESLDKLTLFQENFFYRLIVNCDDYGRMDARPAVLKARLYPLKERVALKDIEGALRALADAGCVSLYAVEGKPFLCLPTWGVHQQIRAKKSKFPAPDITCNQMISDDIKCYRNPIQSNPIRESESEYEYMSGAEAPDRTAAISLTLNDKTEFPVYMDQVDEWRELYPAVDVMQELRNMRGWLNANPAKRKTKSGILRFIAGWLSKEQNKGKTPAVKQQDEARPVRRGNKNWEGIE